MIQCIGRAYMVLHTQDTYRAIRALDQQPRMSVHGLCMGLSMLSRRTAMMLITVHATIKAANPLHLVHGLTLNMTTVDEDTAHTIAKVAMSGLGYVPDEYTIETQCAVRMPEAFDPALCTADIDVFADMRRDLGTYVDYSA